MLNKHYSESGNLPFCMEDQNLANALTQNLHSLKQVIGRETSWEEKFPHTEFLFIGG